MSVTTAGNIPEQIQFQFKQIRDTLSTPDIASNKPVFPEMLMNSINNLNQLQNQAKHQTEDYMTGKPGTGLNDVMVSLQKSSLSLNLGIQVRNKLVSAYQDVMNMAV